MRRLLRIFLFLRWIGLALSTVLSAGTVALWVRSIGYWEEWRFVRFEPRPNWKAPELVGKGIEQTWVARAAGARLWVESEREAPIPTFQPRAEHLRAPYPERIGAREFDCRFQPGEEPFLDGTSRAWRIAGAGFCYQRDAVDPQLGEPRTQVFYLAIPFWMLAAVFGLWPVCFAARRVFRRRRYGAGLCPQCGYDLRATPKRCPECGRHSHERGAGPS